MNKDIILIIQSYLSDTNFIFKSSLVNKDFCHNNRRSQIMTDMNNRNIIQVFSEDDYNNGEPINTSNFDYLFEFLTSKTLAESLQWYANALLKFTPFHKYEIKHHYIMFKTLISQYTSSDGLFSPVRIHRYPCRIHCIYRCRYLNYHRIKNNLIVKALIY